MAARSVKEVIDDAIAENQFPELILYAFSVLFVLCGLFVLVWGAVTGKAQVGLLGALSSALFVPAVRETRFIRLENKSIRLLEIPLGKAATAEEAARALQEFFANTLVKGNNKGKDRP